jgi:hypothetical protein
MEAEIVRLRAENRALLNSILGIAGVPPVLTAPQNTAMAAPAAQHATQKPAPTGAARLPRAANDGLGQGKAIAPARRRSWQQIYRMLEMNSARKKPAGDVV